MKELEDQFERCEKIFARMVETKKAAMSLIDEEIREIKLRQAQEEQAKMY